MTLQRPHISPRAARAFAERGIKPALSVRAAASAAEPAEILLYDEIGPYGITAADFIAALAAVGDGPVRVRINSPGGSVFDGLAIFSALARRAAPVECQVDGLAASAASFIACAGSRLTMAPESMLMIHNAFVVAVGNKDELARCCDFLAKIDSQMAGIYARKTGQKVPVVAAAMAAETWYTAAEAEAAGFADSILAAPDASASAPVVTMPRAGVAAATPAPEDPEPASVADALAAAIEILQDAYELATGTEYESPPDPDDAGGETADTLAALEVRRRRLRLAEVDTQ